MQRLFNANILVITFYYLLLGNHLLIAQASSDEPFRIILSSSMFQNANSQDVAAATRIVAGKLNSESNQNKEVIIEICNNYAELQNQLKKEFDYIYISPIEYLELKEKYHFEPAFVTQTNNNFGDIYYLVTNKKDNHTDISQLKNGIINIYSNSENQAVSLWLDELLLENKLPKKSKFFSKITLENKPSNVILPVFFGKATAAIITQGGFDLLCELNPKIKKELIVINKSKPIVRGMFCFDERKKDEKRKKFLWDYMAKIHQGTGEQIMKLYMVDKLIPFKHEYLDNILELYKQ